MGIYLLESGEVAGPFPLEEVITRLRQGDTDPDQDLAWVDGMGEEWQSVRFVLDLYVLPGQIQPPFTVEERMAPEPSPSTDESEQDAVQEAIRVGLQEELEDVAHQPEAIEKEEAEESGSVASGRGFVFQVIAGVVLLLLFIGGIGFYPYAAMEDLGVAVAELQIGDEMDEDDARDIAELYQEWEGVLMHGIYCRDAIHAFALGLLAWGLSLALQTRWSGIVPGAIYAVVIFFIWIAASYNTFGQFGDMLTAYAEGGEEKLVGIALGFAGAGILFEVVDVVGSLIAAMVIFRGSAAMVGSLWLACGVAMIGVRFFLEQLPYFFEITSFL